MSGGTFIGGLTGGGKSVLTRSIADKLKGYVIVYDMKNTKWWDTFGLHVVSVESFISQFNIHKNNVKRYVIRPKTTLKQNEDITERSRKDIEKLLTKLWRLNVPIFFIIDELANAVRTNRDVPPNMKMWLILGREDNKNIIFCSQRPQFVSTMFLTETRRNFMFQLHPADYKLLKWLPYADELSKAPRYYFIFHDITNNVWKLEKPVNITQIKNSFKGIRGEGVKRKKITVRL